MKQKDIALIIVMVFIGGIVSLAISRVIFSSPKQRQQTAEVVDVITPEFSEPPQKYFNIQSVNPTSHEEVTAETEEDTEQP
jgi:methionine-rich copper-binding protein CopC